VTDLFSSAAPSERHFGGQFYFEDLFGALVDLVTEKALRAEPRPFSARRQRMLRTRHESLEWCRCEFMRTFAASFKTCE